MNKRDITLVVARKTSLTQKDAGKAVDIVFETIVEAMERSEPVRIVGFGTFTTRESKARQRKKPHTGETLGIPV